MHDHVEYMERKRLKRLSCIHPNMSIMSNVLFMLILLNIRREIVQIFGLAYSKIW